VEVKNSSLPHSTKNLSRAPNNDEAVHMQKIFLCYSVLKKITCPNHFIYVQKSQTEGKKDCNSMW
jgi:hypothetical protein